MWISWWEFLHDLHFVWMASNIFFHDATQWSLGNVQFSGSPSRRVLRTPCNVFLSRHNVCDISCWVRTTWYFWVCHWISLSECCHPSSYGSVCWCSLNTKVCSEFTPCTHNTTSVSEEQLYNQWFPLNCPLIHKNSRLHILTCYRTVSALPSTQFAMKTQSLRMADSSTYIADKI
jgi:hypothetical protein